MRWYKFKCVDVEGEYGVYVRPTSVLNRTNVSPLVLNDCCTENTVTWNALLTSCGKRGLEKARASCGSTDIDRDDDHVPRLLHPPQRITQCLHRRDQDSLQEGISQVRPTTFFYSSLASSLQKPRTHPDRLVNATPEEKRAATEKFQVCFFVFLHALGPRFLFRL